VASNRARSCGVSVGSAFNPDRTISSVVFNIIFFAAPSLAIANRIVFSHKRIIM
jgi:hypothetical protein